MDRSIESMFAPDDPLLGPYLNLRDAFGGNAIVLAVYEDPQIWDASGVGVERLGRIRARMEQIPGVKGVLSLDQPMGTRILDQELYVPAKLRELFQDYTHGADGRTVALACMLFPEGETDVPRGTTIAAVRQVMRNLPDGLAPGMVAGEPVLINDAFDYVEQDGDRLFAVTTVLLSIVILFCFRSIRWVIIPIAVVHLSLLLTNGLLSLLQIELSMVSSLLTAVVTVVGIATVVHVTVVFRESRQMGLPRLAALSRTGELVAAPVFWACVTDAIGFGALIAARVGPVRDFGLMMALGSLMVLVSAALVIPGLVSWGRRDTDPHAAWGERTLDTNLASMIRLVLKRPVLVGGGALIASLLAIMGVRWLETDTDFTRNFRSSSPIVQSYEVVESRLGGAGVCDLVLPAPKYLGWDYLKRVLRLEERLRQEVVVSGIAGDIAPGLTKVLSLADVIVGVSPTELQKVRLQRLRQTYISSGLRVMNRKIPEFFAALYAPSADGSGEQCFRIMLRARERQPAAQKQAIIQQVAEIGRAEFPDAEVTGYFVLLSSLIDSMLRDQWKTFAIALVGILLAMAVAFRSPRYALIATVPNVIPILVVNGLMGWLGIRINMGAAMIAAVSIGLTIDGSIHYLMAFQRARAGGKSVADALMEVQQTVGRAMVFSTLALIVGFSALVTSQFIPTIYFGVLMSVSMLGALFGNLLWLPLLLRLFAPATPVVSEIE
jgi:hypothetical protein